MNYILDLIHSFSNYLDNYNEEIAMAISVSILVIFGSGLNGFIKSKIGSMHQAFRWLIFTATCVFIYGLLLTAFSWVVSELLEQLNPTFLSPIVTLTFLILGYLAEKNNR